MAKIIWEQVFTSIPGWGGGEWLMGNRSSSHKEPTGHLGNYFMVEKWSGKTKVEPLENAGLHL